MKQRYLNLFFQSDMLATYDLVAKKWINTKLWIGMDDELSKDLDAYGFGTCFFYQSKFRDLLNAKFKRNRNGEIIVSERPRKLTLAEGIAIAMKKRRTSAASLANLQPEKLTSENRYVKKVSIFTDSILEQAVRHRKDGMSLRNIAHKLNLNYESLRKTLRTKGGSLQNQSLYH